MTELRLLLLVVGLVIIAGLYYYGRRTRDLSNNNYPPVTAGNKQLADSPHLHDQSLQTSTQKAEHKPFSERRYAKNRKMQTENSAEGYFQDDFRDDYSQFSDDANWDELDDLDLEWLEEIADDINYDELMYQLSQFEGPDSAVGYTPDYSLASSGKNIFVASASPDMPRVSGAIGLGARIQPLVLVFHIIRQAPGLMRGADIEQALKTAGLRAGEMKLFHLYEKQQSPDIKVHQQRIFSAANSAESGFFDFENMRELKTPGITLVMQLPGPVEGLFAFERFYNTAQKLAKRLDGGLYDEEKNKVTKRIVNSMKQQIADHDTGLLLEGGTQIH